MRISRNRLLLLTIWSIFLFVLMGLLIDRDVLQSETDEVIYTQNGGRYSIPYTVKPRRFNATDLKKKHCFGMKNVLGQHIPVNMSDVDMGTIESENPDVERGRWEPKDCSPSSRIAVLIPFHSQNGELRILLRHLHTYLKKQRINYTIFVIEQSYIGKFNKGFLYNAGFKHAMKTEHFDCIILHDFALLPEVDKIFYTCRSSPIVMASNMSASPIRHPPTDVSYGSVMSITPNQYIQANGYSGNFYTIGKQDQEFRQRLISKNVMPYTLPKHVGKYVVSTQFFQTKKSKGSQREKEAPKIHAREGLDRTEYRLVKAENRQLYRWILVVNLHPGRKATKKENKSLKFKNNKRSKSI